jgi:hypothetical protein
MNDLTKIAADTSARVAIDAVRARLPQSYEAAKQALAACEQIDECQTWADKMAALASYARQAEDETLLKHAMRIQGRAVRRAGDLLKVIDARPQNAAKQTVGAHGLFSQREAAEKAGMSEHQQLQAVRVASIPADEFEALIETVKPPTVTALAERGKKSRTMPPRSKPQSASSGLIGDRLSPDKADESIRETAGYVRGVFLDPPPGIRASLKEAMARASAEDVRVIAAAADFLTELKEAAK